MPWSNSGFQALTRPVQETIYREFGILPTATILLCTKAELVENLEQDPAIRAFPRRYLENVVFRSIVGKYFAATNEIWVVEGASRGENPAVVTHEVLHSIQRCSPHREAIVDYLSYRLTGDARFISSPARSEWEGLEKIHGLPAIKQRLLTTGDCEDF